MGGSTGQELLHRRAEPRGLIRHDDMATRPDRRQRQILLGSIGRAKVSTDLRRLGGIGPGGIDHVHGHADPAKLWTKVDIGKVAKGIGNDVRVTPPGIGSLRQYLRKVTPPRLGPGKILAQLVGKIAHAPRGSAHHRRAVGQHIDHHQSASHA